MGVGDDTFILRNAEFEVPVGHPHGLGRNHVKRIGRIRREKGKEDQH